MESASAVANSSGLVAAREYIRSKNTHMIARMIAINNTIRNLDRLAMG